MHTDILIVPTAVKSEQLPNAISFVIEAAWRQPQSPAAVHELKPRCVAESTVLLCYAPQGSWCQCPVYKQICVCAPVLPQGILYAKLGFTNRRGTEGLYTAGAMHFPP